MVAQHLAVIAHEDDNCVVGLPSLLQRGEHVSNLCIDLLDHGIVGRYDLSVLLWRGAHEGDIRSAIRSFVVGRLEDRFVGEFSFTVRGSGIFFGS